VRPTKDGAAVVVDVSVGGGPAVPLQLDTGSAGLRIFKQDAGPETKDDPDTGPNTASFVDGTTYEYEAAKAPVVIGGVSVPDPVQVDIVSDVTCEADMPDCVPGTAEEIKGGAHGILGVALTTDDVDSTPSPLLYLPEYRSYTVALDESGAGVVRPGVPATPAVGSWQLPKGDSGVPGVQGWNDFSRQEWGGPCPPKGTHRYFFRLYALNKKLELSPRMLRKDVLRAMEGYIIEKTELVGLYKKF
jgi:hypothetical protein